jgi:hypothetical protein
MQHALRYTENEHKQSDHCQTSGAPIVSSTSSLVDSALGSQDPGAFFMRSGLGPRPVCARIKSRAVSHSPPGTAGLGRAAQVVDGKGKFGFEGGLGVAHQGVSN